MGNTDTMRRFIGTLLIAGLVLGGSGLALAATTDSGNGAQAGSTPIIKGANMPGMPGMNSDMLQSILDSLVAANTITQTQADQIIADQQQLITERQSLKEQIQSKKEELKNMTKEELKTYLDQNRPVRVDFFSQLVKEGTITQEQADAITKAFQEKMAAQRQEQLVTALKGLVDQNIINSEQSGAILSKLSEVQDSRKAQLEAVQGMTAEQGRAYFEANKPEKINPLADLVTAGIITQDQADQVAKVIHLYGDKGIAMHQGRGNSYGCANMVRDK